MGSKDTNEKRVLSQHVYYTTTSNAYKYEELRREEAERQTRIQTKPAAQPKLKKALVFKIALAAAIVLVGAAMLVARYEKMSAMSIRIDALKNQINDIENEIDSLNVKLQYAMDINTAQRIAKDSLGMDYPDSDCVLSVERSAFTAGGTPVYAAVPVQSQAVEGGE